MTKYITELYAYGDEKYPRRVGRYQTERDARRGAAAMLGKQSLRGALTWGFDRQTQIDGIWHDQYCVAFQFGPRCGAITHGRAVIVLSSTPDSPQA